MDQYELAICITDCTAMTLNLLIYSISLAFVLSKHSRTLGLFTKVLLFVPLLEFVVEPFFSLIQYSIDEDTAIVDGP